jgi:hypothetical protein
VGEPGDLGALLFVVRGEPASGESEQLGLEVGRDQVHREVLLGDVYAQRPAAHAADKARLPRCGEFAYHKRRASREVSQIGALLYSKL